MLGCREGRIAVREFDPIGVLEAAYDLAADRQCWLEGLARAARPSLGRGLGAQALLYGVEPGATNGAAAPRVLTAGFDCTPPGTPEFLRQLEAFPSESFKRQFWSRPTRLWTFSELATPYEQGCFTDGRLTLPGVSVRDYNMMLVRDHGHWLLMFGGLSPQRERIPRILRTTWRKLGTHLQVALRLRLALATAPDRVTEQAVLDSTGEVLHAEAEARSKMARARLREAALRMRRSRGPLRRRDPQKALDLWRALVSGTWTLVDRFESDGKHLVVAMRNDDSDAPFALTGLQRQVAELAALGYGNKQISYAMGIKESTVAAHLPRVMDRLGVDRREDLALLAGAPPASTASLASAEVAVASAHFPLPSCLTQAEAEVVQALLVGGSNQAIARRRGVSERTVANQLQSVFRKLGVASRVELVAWLTKRAAS